ncbi:MAG TPA: ORF6C domain-containing protein [Candidatus Enterococcus avicola]|uniref:ORF6C domain-containing protein n=1 Tax=Candidatus Enterococcus avicola TaxID=2838561 RepID=A0A9D2F6P1_9ENTE|nr:ORF6C domain-containing protein [Candidatus Enterococcus avicola]
MDNTPVANKENRSLEALQFTLKRQDDQSKALQEVITAVIDVKDEMVEMRDETKREIKAMRDDNKISRRQASKLKTTVGKKSAQLVARLFGKHVSSELFTAKMGHMTRGIYTKLGIKFDVASYLDVRHIDFEQAINFVDGLGLEDFEDYQLRITDKQAEIATKHGDDIAFLMED